MKTWKCTNQNPGWQAKGKACGEVQLKSMKIPKDKCPNCNKSTFWKEVIAAPSVAVAAVLAWPATLPPRLVTALAGEYVTTENNDAGDTATGLANTTYGGGKHWGGDWEAGQYDLPEVGANVVLGLETKAVRIGLQTAGGWIFTFSFVVGHTSKKGNNKGLPYDETFCIRVDGGATVATGMHSHPIPQWGGLNTSAHEKEVKAVIIDAVNTFNGVRLAEVAEYLTLIGAAQGAYKFTKSELMRMKNPLPESFFW